jgi:hypothetical protein
MLVITVWTSADQLRNDGEKAMCAKNVIDLIDFDREDQKQRKALEAQRDKMKNRRDEIIAAIQALEAKLG